MNFPVYPQFPPFKNNQERMTSITVQNAAADHVHNSPFQQPLLPPIKRAGGRRRKIRKSRKNHKSRRNYKSRKYRH